jgi:SAM-dependent methyltransferase
LNPSPFAAHYVHLRSLRAAMQRAIERNLGGRSGLSIIDVGCGDRPYEPLLAPYAGRYVGVDYRPGPKVDLVAPAEALPVPSESFDCLISSQVLEHVDDPYAVMREVHRVLKPGGVALVSTHGTVNYHPNPDDYWRWTHAGLAQLFRLTGEWTRVDVHPNGGTGSALAYLVGRQLEALAYKLKARWLTAVPSFALNVAGWNLDRLYRRAYPSRPPDLSSNYLAVGIRGGDASA